MRGKNVPSGMRAKHIIILMILVSALLFIGQTTKNVSLTNVYYLAKNIDDSLVSMYGLESVLAKKPICDKLRAGNVYLKALSVVSEFSTLHPNAIDALRLREASSANFSRTKPADVYVLLEFIRDYFVSKNALVESAYEQSRKTPNDVFQMLRQISMHHHEITRQMNRDTDGATSARIYESLISGILPVTTDIARRAKISYQGFSFPEQPVTGIIPRHVYHLLYHMYQNLSQYYMNKGGYDPIFLSEMNDCDEVSSADVSDLVQLISAELRTRAGNRQLETKTLEHYRRWRQAKPQIVDGDVFRLIQYNFILTQKILKNTE